MSLNRLRPIVPTAQVGSFMSSSIGIPSAAGAFVFSSLVPIAWTQLGSTSSSVTFSSIPQTFQDLELVCSPINSTTASNMTVRFNGDTGTNYSRTQLWGDGSSALSARASNESLMYFGSALVSPNIGLIKAYMLNYTASTNKTVIARAGQVSDIVICRVNLWRNTSAITSITCSTDAGQFATGSTFALYGVKAS